MSNNKGLPSHISSTQVNMWLRCPRSWDFRYIRGLKIRPAGVLIQGGAYHESIAVNYTSKIETETDLTVEEVQDAFADAWVRRIKEEGSRDGIDWEGESPDRMKDEGVRMVGVYQANAAPTVQPALVEAEMDGLVEGVRFKGILDLLTKERVVADHKLSGKSKTQDEADRDLQLTAYSFLCLIHDLGLPEKCQLHVAVKTQTPKIQILTTTRTLEDIDWWAKLVVGVRKQMASGIAPPNPTGWHCSPKFCGYWDLCKGKK